MVSYVQSYGVNGTLPSSFYGYQNWYKYGQYYNGKSGMAIVGIGNPELQWEKNRSVNFGLDLTLLDRISVTSIIMYVQHLTSSLIYQYQLSLVTIIMIEILRKLLMLVHYVIEVMK